LAKVDLRDRRSTCDEDLDPEAEDEGEVMFEGAVEVPVKVEFANVG
jgi:hypothetical protein